MIVILLTGVPVATAATITSPLSDTMTTYDAAVWQKSDGWSNGAPFQVGWRADHLSFAASLLTLKLDNQPACSTASAVCSFQPYASGEYKSIDSISYGRLTFRAKAASGSGAITGLFTYTGAPVHDEIDIEILGKNTGQVQFNYFVAGVGGHEKIVTLGFDAALGFHDYTIEWLPSAINWYVDGVLKYTVYATTGVTLPSHPQHIFMNLWAATGVPAWSGLFTYTTPITAQVDLVNYTPAVGAAPASGGGCVIASSTDWNHTDSTLWLVLLLLTMRVLIRKKSF